MEEFESYRAAYQKTGGSFDIIVGSLPNAISTMLGILLAALIFGSKAFFQNASSYTIGVAIYEIIQLYLPERTFDIWDIVATLAVYIVVIVFYFSILWIVEKRKDLSAG
ncbi:hypothetical protein [uncultured Microbulbifer sp.]|uniref:hypothetical protein n=1 Tax=uncultured Microbulbifer sp. TaxID=348147 RepID=UPI00262AAB9E|nr:hypothetical protein [uncultured Microbulbifer sp.]